MASRKAVNVSKPLAKDEATTCTAEPADYIWLRKILTEILGSENVIPTRIPFTYHHDAARVYAASLGFRDMSRGDIASKVRYACGDNKELYEAEMFLGTIIYFLQYHPVKMFTSMTRHHFSKIMRRHQKVLAKNNVSLFWYVTW